MPEILAAGQWFPRHDRLDTDQRRLVDNGVFANGSNVGWILGPAGSGKTIVLAHALNKAKADGKSVVFISYTHALLNLAKQGLDDGISRITYLQVNGMPDYDLAVVDEVQDVPSHVLHTICSKAKQVIFAGDETQKIYEDGAAKEELTGITGGNDHRLTRAYRLTPKVHAAASALYPASLEGVQPSGRTMVDIMLYSTLSNDGYAVCYKIASDKAAKGNTAVILFPKNDGIVAFANWALQKADKAAWTAVRNRYGKMDYGSLNAHLTSNGLRLQVVQNKYGDLGDAFRNNHVVIQTYHSSKGLDYNCVCLPDVSPESASPDPAFQKALFFVAITRASGALVITQRQCATSTFVDQIKPFCTQADPARVQTSSQTDDDF